MNIYALPGSKVVVTEQSINNGYKLDTEQVTKHCTIGTPYTVVATRVHSSTTEVYLQEFPGISFNSVNFEDYGADIKLTGAVVKRKGNELKIKFFPTTQAAMNTFNLIDTLDYDVLVNDIFAEVCDDPLELKSYCKFAQYGSSIIQSIIVILVSSYDDRLLVVGSDVSSVMKYLGCYATDLLNA